MKMFIVAIPLFDSNMVVRAYRMCDQSGDKALSVKNDFRGRSEAFLSPGLDLVEKIGLAPFAGDKPLFVDISRFQLLTGMPANLAIDPSRLVCLLPGGMPTDADLLARCQELKSKGYAIALDKFPLSGMQSPYLDVADYLLLDYKNMRFREVFAAVTAGKRHLQIVVENVPDRDSFDALCRDKSSKVCLYSGQFYSRPITRGAQDVSPLKANALQLLRQVNEEDFELTDIAGIVERDPALSVSLLRFINSGAIGLPNHVDSIQNAVAILGQEEVRRWAAVAISVSLAQDSPGEVTKLSLVRAKFAENLAVPFALDGGEARLFMAGLFSLLDVILQRPMAQAVEEVAVSRDVREALVGQAGPLYKVLQLMYAYERADWDTVSISMIQNKLDIDDVSGSFINALIWYNQLLASVQATGGEV